MRITIASVGDMMIGTDFPENHLPDDDGVSFLADVTPVLSAADVLVVTDVYAAGEAPIPGASRDDLVAGLIRHGHRHAVAELVQHDHAAAGRASRRRDRVRRE